MLGKNLIAAAGNGISTVAVAEAIDFDGTNDFLSRSSDMTGNANSKTFTFSTFFYTAASGTRQRFLADGVGYVAIEYDGGRIDVVLYNTALSVVLDAATVTTVPSFTWMHILISVNMDSTATRSIYINDQAASVTWTTYTTGQTIDWTHPVWRIGQSSALMKGRLSNLFLDYTYRDLSNATNRRLFVTADLKPAAGQASLNPILYLPMNDPTVPGANAGTGGNFTLTGVVARSGRGPNQYNAPYSDLDGSADYLSRTTALTGIADGKTFTVNWCGNFDADAGNQVFTIATSTTARFYVLMGDGSGRVQVVAYNSSGTTILNGYSASSLLVSGRNYVITISVDLSNTSNRHCYVNGTSVAMTWSPYTNSDIDFAVASSPVTRVGVSSSTANYFNGKLGALWFNTSYIDLSVAANLAKFVSGTGINAAPVDLGATGELPTGTSPLIYLPMYGNNAGKNYGTGGDFTVNSGPYTGARGPNEFWGNLADFNGTTGYLSRTSALSGVSDGKTFTASFFFKSDDIATNGRLLTFCFSNGYDFRVGVDGSGYVFIKGDTSAGVEYLRATASTTAMVAGTTYSIQVSIDLNNTSNRRIYVNGVSQSATWTTYTNQNFPWTTMPRVTVGAIWNGSGYSSLYNGTLSELYFTTDYIDFSQEANRLKFRDAFGNPVNLTQQIEDAAIPNPAIYTRFPPTSFGTNSGTGGDFTVNGTITDGGQL
jgi:hypothetical protein